MAADVRLCYQTTTRDFVVLVKQAREVASTSLFDLLTKQGQLVQRLKTIKDYFLMTNGDVFLHFLDAASGKLGLATTHVWRRLIAVGAEELEKLNDSVGADRLLTLLELAQRTSTSRDDPYNDEIGCRLMGVNLVTELFRIMNISHDSQVRVAWLLGMGATFHWLHRASNEPALSIAVRCRTNHGKTQPMMDRFQATKRFAWSITRHGLSVWCSIAR